MKPENLNVKFNVDVKVQNDPEHLFKLLSKTITTQPEWQTKLAPRILLGLWHPRFIGPAKEHLPFCRRSAISNSPIVCRDYFWNDVDTFSMHFASLTTLEGQKSVSSFIYALIHTQVLFNRFKKECKAAGKSVMVWTVNEPMHLMEVRHSQSPSCVGVLTFSCNKGCSLGSDRHSHGSHSDLLETKG